MMTLLIFVFVDADLSAVRCEHDSKPCLAAHHQLVGFGGALQRIDFGHRAHSAERTERKSVLGINGRTGVPAGDRTAPSNEQTGRYFERLMEERPEQSTCH